MQATMYSSALAPAPRLQFARRGTMVRSQKRRRTVPLREPEQNYDRPPRRRRPRAGFFYKLITVLLLLIVWPIGLIPLWRRKLRWSGLAKLFVSIITLMACILLIGTALTVDTHNPRITALQDEAGDFLNSAMDSIIDFSVNMGERATRSWNAVRDIYDTVSGGVLLRSADAIDWGVDLARDVRTTVGGWLNHISGQPEATPAPETEGEGEAAAPGEEEAAESEPSAAPTSAPAAQIFVSTSDEELPVYIPESTPDASAGSAVYGGMLLRSGALDANALPTPTPSPEPEKLDFEVKPAGEATVYFNIGSGQFYHMAPVCGSMKNADEHRFAETAENIHEPCERCAPPDKSLLQETYIVWLDEGERAHLSDECPAFEGQWKLLPAQEAIDAGYEGCPECGADLYLRALSEGKEVTIVNAAPTPEATPEAPAEPTPEPTAEPTLEPTPEPTPQVVTPRETLKPAGEAVVYHSSNGKYYHMNDHCSGMTGGKPYALEACLADGFQQCNTCGAPAPEALDHPSLWVDEQNVCHVSDECEYFVGLYRLVDRDEALNDGLVGCSHCGAQEYLIPFTVLDTYASLSGDETL